MPFFCMCPFPCGRNSICEKFAVRCDRRASKKCVPVRGRAFPVYPADSSASLVPKLLSLMVAVQPHGPRKNAYSHTNTHTNTHANFSSCGPISSVRLAVWNHTKQQKGFGYIEFEKETSADNAARKTGMKVCDSELSKTMLHTICAALADSCVFCPFVHLHVNISAMVPSRVLPFCYVRPFLSCPGWKPHGVRRLREQLHAKAKFQKTRRTALVETGGRQKSSRTKDEEQDKEMSAETCSGDVGELRPLTFRFIPGMSLPSPKFQPTTKAGPGLAP